MSLVTVTCNIVGIEAAGTTGDILRASTILNSLFENDTGNISPNPKTKYQLHLLNLNVSDFNKTLEEKDLGKPYAWAQKLCGFDFANITDSQNIKNDLSVNVVPEIVKVLRQRWESRFIIQKQIQTFEENNSDFISTLKISSVRLSSNIVQCTPITSTEYLNYKQNSLFIMEDNIEQNSLLYRIVLTRGSAKLECYVSIPCNFPTFSPYWIFELNWNGSHNSDNNSSIREMEFWVNNAIQDVKNSSKILIKQMERALYCLDIYTETEGHFIKPSEFNQEKTFLKIVRGRQRARPFKMINNEECGVFTQIKFN